MAVTLAIGLRVPATQGLADGDATTLTALAKLEQVLPPALRERVHTLGAHLQPARPAGAPVAPVLLGGGRRRVPPLPRRRGERMTRAALHPPGERDDPPHGGRVG
ncbi:MAG: transcriptional regulator [Naasia sp.]|nr:transcriptional regulator [Naasia sp.]